MSGGVNDVTDGMYTSLPYRIISPFWIPFNFPRKILRTTRHECKANTLLVDLKELQPMAIELTLAWCPLNLESEGISIRRSYFPRTTIRGALDTMHCNTDERWSKLPGMHPFPSYTGRAGSLSFSEHVRRFSRPTVNTTFRCSKRCWLNWTQLSSAPRRLHRKSEGHALRHNLSVFTNGCWSDWTPLRSVPSNTVFWGHWKWQNSYH
jgi:hypothetical protein